MRYVLAWTVVCGLLFVLAGCGGGDGTSPAPALVPANAEAVALRYNFQSGRVYGYDITIRTDTEDYTETQKGWSLYRVTSAGSERFA